jgi:hypothetical protein
VGVAPDPGEGDVGVRLEAGGPRIDREGQAGAGVQPAKRLPHKGHSPCEGREDVPAPNEGDSTRVGAARVEVSKVCVHHPDGFKHHKCIFVK